MSKYFVLIKPRRFITVNANSKIQAKNYLKNKGYKVKRVYSENQLKKLNWKQSKNRFPFLKSNGNIDRDSKKNKKDCKPFNKRKQDLDDHSYYEDADLVVSPRVYNAFHDLRRGLSPSKLSKSYSNTELDDALEALSYDKRGKRIKANYR